MSFSIMPPWTMPSSENIAPFDWEIFFNEAGLENLQRTEIDPRQNPAIYADTIDAWQISSPDWPDTSFRIEVAAFRGKPTSFEIIGPWPHGEEKETVATGQWISLLALGLFLLIIIIGGLFFARQNLRLGRGDRRSTTRLAIFIGCVLLLRQIFSAQHILTFRQIFDFFGSSLLIASLLWLLYMALEPFVRRRWPHILVSWTRLLSGTLHDTLVARDVLIGCAFGIFIGLFIFFASSLNPKYLWHFASNFPSQRLLEAISGVDGFISVLLLLPFLCLFFYVGLLGILFIFRAVLRNQRIAAVAFILLGAGMTGGADPWTSLLMIVLWTMGYFILMRFGFLAVIMQVFSSFYLQCFPMTFNNSAWYSDYGYAALVIFAVIVLYAFHTSLGGRPLFGTPRLDN